ncbi:MAG: homoserine kinase [Solirubrobacterales bacterium]
MGRRRRVRVPGSSANLGPGFDSMAAAVSVHLELEVEETGTFAVDPGDPALPADESNLCVRAFADLHPVHGLTFRVRSDIPLEAGLGSSGAAIVAALVAADHMYELALPREEMMDRAAAIEGHPDNVAASLHGGFVVCADGEVTVVEPPSGLEAVAVVPSDPVPTGEARAALPADVPLADATFNAAHAATLALGLARGDLALIARGLEDRLHQPRRRHLYPRSMELIERARELGALGATISGAGPTVLFWVFFEQTGAVVDRLREEVGGWADVRRLNFVVQGADVAEL